jgi:NADPH-dependent glutamate synthase beta subunit-like oxidoreductase
VAVDSARTAVRLGAKSVTLVCVESGADVPAHEWDIREAREEGVVVMEGWAPAKFLGEHNELEGVLLHKVTNFQKSSQGIKFDTDTNDAKTLPAEWVITAIGQAPSPIWKAYEGDEDVFFAGDIVSAECSVVDSMASGIEIAVKVDESLQYRAIKGSLDERTLNLAPINEKIYPATRLVVARPPLPIADPAVRASNFDEVETEYDAAVIAQEVSRCLQCGYSEVDETLCIGCGACRQVCPKGDVITMVQTGKGGN